MEAFHEREILTHLPREAPHTTNHEEIGMRVDDLFASSDLEVIRILTQYLQLQKGEQS